jgi:hypothetical protein
MTSRPAAAVAALFFICTQAPAADVFTLITPADVAAERRYEAQPNDQPGAHTRSLDTPAATPTSPPQIQVVAPQPSNPTVASPLRIELKFSTSADARILPDTFRVLYGLLKIDITSKLRPYAQVTDKGLVAENAAVPAGNHRLFLQISDSAGRTTVSQWRLTVSGTPP